MLGVLRTAVAAGMRSPAHVQLPSAVANAKSRCLPFIPTDWIFRFFPYVCRDRVRFMLRFNQISFAMGFGYLMVWSHAPYKCDHYEGFYESPLYRHTVNQLSKTGQLEENLRIKRKKFYLEAE